MSAIFPAGGDFQRDQPRKSQGINITDTAEVATTEAAEIFQDEVELEKLHACLRVCKMDAKAETFAAAHGSTCLTNLSEVTIVQDKTLTKMFNDEQTSTSMLSGVLHQPACSTDLLGAE